MPESNGISVFYHGMRIPSPIIWSDSVATNASGVARLYLTRDGTATGEPVFRTVTDWITDIETTVPVNSRSMISGVNYIDVTVTQFQFNGIVLLGINVLGSVTTIPVNGASVKFIVLGI